MSMWIPAFHSAFLRRVRMGEIELEAAYIVFEAFDRDLRMFNLFKMLRRPMIMQRVIDVPEEEKHDYARTN